MFATCGRFAKGRSVYVSMSTKCVDGGYDDDDINNNNNVLIAERDASNGIATLILNRPKQRNALSLELLERLGAELDLLAKDKAIRAVVVAGNGPVFSSGHDLKEVHACSVGEADPNHLFDFCSKVMQQVVELPQPVICAVDGVATAAGCQLAASCDLVVANASSTFSTPGVRIGLFCTTPAVALARSVGKKAAMDMLLTGRAVGAKEAKQMGLISHIVEGNARQAADVLAAEIADASGEALRVGKSAFREQVEKGSLGEAYCVASAAMAGNATSDDCTEGIDAFFEKRTPQWNNHDEC